MYLGFRLTHEKSVTACRESPRERVVLEARYHVRVDHVAVRHSSEVRHFEFGQHGNQHRSWGLPEDIEAPRGG
jgi:hypothetical protein